jgi:hypothetical protein
MRHPLRPLACLALFLWMLTAMTVAQTPVIGVDELRPGMVGVGRTVFSGTALEEFKAHILGVIRNVVGPGRNLVLARLEGGPLAKTGVIAGMSGSPVYIDGRLLGAVSYALGQFSTEPIAGITPIGEMTEATASTAPRPASAPVALAFPASPADLVAIWARDLGRTRPFAQTAADALVLPGSARDLTPELGAMLRPIAVPLVASGFDEDVLSPLSAAFSATGMVPMVGPMQRPPAGSSPSAPALRPGDAIGVTLLSGDFELGATGTVTHVDGDRVYAFGHPLYNLGPTAFPMTRADVTVVLPSLMQSSKLASLGEVVGTLQQDRATAIAGRLGPGPSLIPVKVTLNSERAPTRTFSFGVVRDPTFTPLLSYLAVANVLTSYERAAGPTTFTVRGTARIKSEGDLTFEDIFTGDQPAGPAAAYIAAPLTMLLRNVGPTVDVENITLTIDASEQTRTARIERVWLDTSRPRSGGSATVFVALRDQRGEETIKQVPIELPANVTGSVQLLVSDAVRIGADDRTNARGADLQRASQIIRTFNKARRNNRLYVRLSVTDSGAIVNGEPMAALPPSVLAVIDADRAAGSVSSLRSAIRGEWEISVDVAVSGSRLLTLTLDQP